MPAKKSPGSVHTAKNGARYKILANGRARFVSGPTKKKRTKKGGSIAIGGGLKRKRRTKKGGGFLGDVGRDVRKGFNYYVRDTLK